MKKTLALVLALVLALSMSVVAFATDAKDVTRGWAQKDGVVIELELDENAMQAVAGQAKWELEDLKVSTKWSKDSALKAVTLDADKALLKIELVKNYGIKDLELVGSIEIKKGSEKVTAEVLKAFTVDGLLKEGDKLLVNLGIGLDKDVADYVAGPITSGGFQNVYKFTDGEHTIEFDGAPKGAEFKVKTFDQGIVNLTWDQKGVKAIAVANPDAKLSFFNVIGENSFDFVGELKFYVDKEDKAETFIYGVKDGALVPVTATYDEGDEVFVIKTNTLGSYVISDKALANVAAADKDNVDTGASNLVSVAVAAAVVSVAAVAAVASKKSR